MPDLHEENECMLMAMGANEVSQHILCHHEEGLWLGKSTECACQYYTVSTHIYVYENTMAKGAQQLYIALYLAAEF